MKNKKLTLIASIMLVAAILCGSVSAAAVDYSNYTTAPTMGPTTTPSDQTTTMPTTNQSTVTTVPTTDNNYESDEAYDEGTDAFNAAAGGIWLFEELIGIEESEKDD